MTALHAMSTVARNVSSLYRDILKAAKYFPSRKRDNIIKEIKAEFHANKVSHVSQLDNGKAGSKDSWA